MAETRVVTRFDCGQENCAHEDYNSASACIRLRGISAVPRAYLHTTEAEEDPDEAKNQSDKNWPREQDITGAETGCAEKQTRSYSDTAESWPEEPLGKRIVRCLDLLQDHSDQDMVAACRVAFSEKLAREMIRLWSK